MAVRFWWVNQGDTYRGAFDQRAIWAPYKSLKTDRDQEHWRRMDDVQPGDVIVHYSVNRIRAVSTALARARSATVSIQRGGEQAWSELGREISLESVELDPPVAIDVVSLAYRQQWSAEFPNSPFDRRGRVKQGYLFELDPAVYEVIFGAAGLVAEPDDDVAELRPGGERRGQLAIMYRPDGQVVVVTRGEHAQLHRYVFQGKDEHTCDLCGRTLPVSLLVLAHIKKRSQATDEEKLNPAIAMRACALGCDDLYERGYIVVDEDGVIAAGRRARGAGPDLEGAITERVGRVCSAFDSKTMDFFAWHYEENRPLSRKTTSARLRHSV